MKVKQIRLHIFCPTLLFVLLCIFPSFKLLADNTIDSLKRAVSIAKSDTEKANIMHDLVVDLITIGHYPQADSLQTIEMKLSQKSDFKKGIAEAILNKGIIQYYQGDYPEGLSSLFNSLKLCENINDKHGKASSILYIGYIYEGQGDAKRAMDYFTQSSKLFEELNDDDYDATAIINIGNLYSNLLHDYGRAMGYYIKSMKLFTKAKDDDGVGSALKDIGNMYLFEKDTAEAIENLEKGQNIFKELNDNEGFAQAEISLGNIYLGQKKYSKALEYAENANQLGKGIGSFVDIKESEKLLSSIYFITKDNVKSLLHYKAYIAAKDSLTNQENTKKSIRTEMNFEFEKKQTIAKAEQDQKDLLQQAQVRKQRLIIYFISGIVLLFLCLAIFVFRSYLQKQKANKELDIRNRKIEAAYRVIEEKNLEITDSINYAKRIQHAILPDEEVLKKILPQSFVLFMPKDIVSGDFYFVKESKDTIFLAAADCTGHGVPGAFMSMIGSEKLHEAVQQSNDTAQILQVLNKGIKSSLHQSGSESTRDGMDIALISMAPLNSPEGGTLSKSPTSEGGEAVVLNFSGANRPLWIIRKGAAEIEELKADKKAIGGFTEEEQSFERKEISLNKGDTFYIFSDGYADQFGGEQGKKLSTRKFKEILLNIQNKSMLEQRTYLEGFIDSWKAEKEQLDDILIIGVRI
ncbi:MAG TPA: tetratricopeptide repeat protein [Bacteroidia bacterium]|nr:tetratricopeptide repeat protein [Bacteroidia bacterium]